MKSASSSMVCHWIDALPLIPTPGTVLLWNGRIYLLLGCMRRSSGALNVLLSITYSTDKGDIELPHYSLPARILFAPEDENR